MNVWHLLHDVIMKWLFTPGLVFLNTMQRAGIGVEVVNRIIMTRINVIFSGDYDWWSCWPLSSERGRCVVWCKPIGYTWADPGSRMNSSLCVHGFGSFLIFVSFVSLINVVIIIVCWCLLNTPGGALGRSSSDCIRCVEPLYCGRMIVDLIKL